MIHVTKTFLPDKKTYLTILDKAWEAGWITNRGQLVLELENKLKQFLNVRHVLAMANGTLPLQLSIKALGLKGEIITTPFSYIATTSSIVWEGCTPVFVDIHPEYLTVDESKIEAAITDETSAILATHVFGNPCDVEAIQAIADKHDLKVIYDAAHCFGVNYKEQSIFNYGNISTCSFHATKIFHTGEGGALFCSNQELYKVLFYHHNFGHKGKEAFQGLGINAKMSELQAAMGLAVLPYMQNHKILRKNIVDTYNTTLPLQLLKIREHCEWNYSYYPVIFKSEGQLLHVEKALNKARIYPRRYFYPSLNTLDYIKYQDCPISESIASRILCLPLYVGLSKEDQTRIIDIILINL